MSDAFWVVLGGAVGAALTIILTRRWPGHWAAFSVVLAASALLGVFAQTGPHGSAVAAFVGFGLLGTAASLTLILDNSPVAPVTIRGAFRLLRRFVGAIATRAFLCATFAMFGYLCSGLVMLLHFRLPWL